MKPDLTDFCVVITGASDGLGFAMARTLLLHGANVAVASRPGEKLTKAIEKLNAQGLAPLALPMDVRNEDSVNLAADRIRAAWGRVDMLVNNAGLGMGRVNPYFATEPKLFFEIDTEGFRDVIDTNLTGYFLVAKAFVPMMIEQKSGRIVTISTSLTTMRRKYMSPYGPSRAGSEALSEIMTEELRDHGIDVNVLLPGGPVDTGLLPEESRASFEKMMRMMSPSVMEAPILYLASEEAKGLTGERIIANEFDAWLSQRK